MNHNKSGQSLLEFCLLLQGFVVALSLALLVGLKSLVPFWMQIDLYDLARAHIYGNDLHLCEPSWLWPRHLIQVEFSCPEIPRHYEARAFLVWNDSRVLIAETRYALEGITP